MTLLPPGYDVSTDPERVDIDRVVEFLTVDSYWAKGRPRDVIERSFEHSLCFGVYRGREQAGFARVVTDRAVFAYLCDLFVLPEHRGHGLGKALVQAVVDHPELQGLRWLLLATYDAHGLYEQFGFEPLENPERFMAIHRPGIA
jgi:GNAT superfamily N-acetyltransferase